MNEFTLDAENMMKVHSQFTEDDCVCEEHELKAILKAQKLTRLAVFQLAGRKPGPESRKIIKYYKDRIKHVRNYHQKH